MPAVLKKGEIAILASRSNFLEPTKPEITIVKTSPTTYRLNLSFVFRPDIENNDDIDITLNADYFVTKLGPILNSSSLKAWFEEYTPDQMSRLYFGAFDTTVKKVNHQGT